jgi:hypothetical protein
MKIGLNSKCVLMGTCVDLNLLWHRLSRLMQIAQQDVVIKDQLDEAIASIL